MMFLNLNRDGLNGVSKFKPHPSTPHRYVDFALSSVLSTGQKSRSCPCELSTWSLHVLLVSVFCGFSKSKNMHVSQSGNSPSAVGLSVSAGGCLSFHEALRHSGGLSRVSPNLRLRTAGMGSCIPCNPECKRSTRK